MQFVLLGATGFLGHHLLPDLSAAGHRCLVLSRYRPACRELSIIPDVQLLQTDVYDADRLKAAFEGADAVISMAGILNESGRGTFDRVHVQLVETIIEACRASGIRRLLHVSALNAGKGESRYLVSKGQAEDLIHAASDIDSTIFQPSVIFGVGDDFFNRFAGLLKMAPVLPLACPESRMQPVWVGDVAAAISRAVVDPETIGKTLVLVGPKEYTLRELVEFTAAAVGLRRRIVGLSDGFSRLQGRMMGLVPGKPFSFDNYLSLQVDNTSVENSLWSLGIRPRSIESVVPVYLNRSPHQCHLDNYRKRAGR